MTDFGVARVFSQLSDFCQTCAFGIVFRRMVSTDFLCLPGLAEPTPTNVNDFIKRSSFVPSRKSTVSGLRGCMYLKLYRRGRFTGEHSLGNHRQKQQAGIANYDYAVLL